MAGWNVGRTGWHLPTKGQLQSLLGGSDIPNNRLFTQTSWRPGHPIPPNHHFWTASDAPNETGTATGKRLYVVSPTGIDDVPLVHGDKHGTRTTHATWCVRGGYERTDWGNINHIRK